MGEELKDEKKGSEEEDKDEDEKKQPVEKEEPKPQYKPKKGDYQVQVHVIEARDLKGRGVGDMSDPVVEVSVLGQKKMTSIKKSSLNCTWDEILFYEQKDMDPTQIDTEKIRINVKDANTFRRDLLIGSFEIDLGYVYHAQDHELYRKWVALTDVTDEHEGVQGYLKLSVVVLGPDDEMKIHGDEDDDDDESGMLMPPHIEQKGMLLKVKVHDVHDLIDMDDGILTRTRCDPYVKVEFAGLTSKTSVFKGQSVNINEEIQIPVMEPIMANTIKVSVWDYDVGIQADDLIGTFNLNYATVKASGLAPQWKNMYGAPQGYQMYLADQANKGIIEGTSFRGRALVSASVIENESPQADLVPIPRLSESEQPKMIQWCLQCDVYEAVELPRPGKWKVEVGIGAHCYSTNEFEAQHGKIEVYSSIRQNKSDNLLLSLPQDIDQVPDVFVYLTRKTMKRTQRISYYRFPFKQLVGKGWKASPVWIPMKEDRILDKLESHEFPGLLLIGLRAGTADAIPPIVSSLARPFKEDAYLRLSVADVSCIPEDSKTSETELSESRPSVPISDVGSCKITVVRAKDLPIADSTSSDPYVLVSTGSQKFKTSIKKKNLNPEWNESKDFPDLPVRAEISVQVYDWDMGSKDDLLGSFKFSLANLSKVPPGVNFTVDQWFLIGSEISPTAQVLLRFEYTFYAAAHAAEVKKAELKKQTSFSSKLKSLVTRDSSVTHGDEFFGKPTCNQFQIRAHIYQGRQLPALDRTGLSDPYVVVRCAGQSAKTVVREQTLNPIYYSTKPLVVNLPMPLELAPDIQVLIFDKDQIGKDEVMGRFSVSIIQAMEMNPAVGELDPKWFDLYDMEGKKSDGQILAAFQVLPVEMSSLPLPSLKPRAIPMFLEVSTLGLRSLSSVIGVYKPRVEFELPDGKKFRTNTSRTPNSANPNYLQVLRIPVKVPSDKRYAPALTLSVRDVLFGGLLKRLIGTSSLLLENFMVLGEDGNWKTDQQLNILNEKELENEIAALEKKEEEKRIEEKKAIDTLAPLEASRKTDAESHKSESPPEEIPLLLNVEQSLTAPPTTVEAPNGKVDFVMLEMTTRDERKQVEPKEQALMIKPLQEEKKEHVSVDIAGENKDEEEEEDEKTPLLPEKHNDCLVCDIDEKVVALEEEKPAYLKGRDIVDNELEDVMVIKPFDEVQLVTGKRAKDKNRQVGRFKGLVRLCDDENVPSSIETKDLLAPKDVFVRVYILRGKGLTPMDNGGASDPYLVVSLGNQRINLRHKHLDNTLSPEFYESFEFPTQIPGPSELKIEVWDWDGVGDDLIGYTTIDVEDRWFCKQWRMIKKKPVEWRTLHNPSSSMPQGKIELWVDIFHAVEAKNHPLINIAPPPKEEYELRVIVWQCADVTIKDAITQQNDLYITGLLDGPGARRQRTDTHLRSKKGKGSFNWRMKFPVTLPMKSPRFSIQIWDMDFFSPNDSICEALLGLSNLFKKAYRVKDRVKLVKGGKDRFWLDKLRHPNEGDKNQGRVEVSFEIMPMSVASQLPAGLGRSDPNMNPVLPPPEGRLEWMNLLFNPLKLLREILGDKLYLKLCCGFICLILIVTVIFITPNVAGSAFVRLTLG